MLIDYYKILGVSRSATQLDIKKAYRQLAIQFHPDKNKSVDAHERFIEIHEAFEVLHNYTGRKQYDRLYDDYFLKKKKVDPAEKEKWESSINKSSNIGKRKGEKFEEDYDLFSRKIMKRAFFYLFLELVLSFIFGDLSGTGILFGVFLFIGGIIVGIVNFDTTGIILGGLLSIVGVYFIRKDLIQYSKELRENKYP